MKLYLQHLNKYVYTGCIKHADINTLSYAMFSHTWYFTIRFFVNVVNHGEYNPSEKPK